MQFVVIILLWCW